MMTTILALAHSTLIALFAGGVFWLVLRKFRGVSPNVHRLIWFGVLLLGLCIVRWPVNIPYYAPESTVTAQIVPQGEAQFAPNPLPMQLSNEVQLASVHDGNAVPSALQGNVANGYQKTFYHPTTDDTSRCHQSAI
jgi:hypothetical protein